MKKFIFILLLLLLKANACYKHGIVEDLLSTGEKSRFSMSKKYLLDDFPKKSMCLIVDSAGNIGSAICIGPKTALTSVHVIQTTYGNDPVITTGNKSCLFNQYEGTFNFQETKNSWKRNYSTFSYELLGTLKQTTHFKKRVIGALEASSDLRDDYETSLPIIRKGGMDVLMQQKVLNFGSNDYELVGSDLAVITFTNPLRNAEPIKIFDQSVVKTYNCQSSYLVGYHFKVQDLSGRSCQFQRTIPRFTALDLQLVPVFQTVSFSESEVEPLLYSHFVSYAGKDESFIPDRTLGSPHYNNLFGRMITGQSGGGLFIKDGDEWFLGGVASGSLYPPIESALGTIVEAKNKFSVLASELLEDYSTKTMPTYDIYSTIPEGL